MKEPTTYYAVTYALAIISIVGYWYNMRGNKNSYAIWTFTNVCWIAVDLYLGVYSQAAMLVAFTAMTVYGYLYMRWNNGKCKHRFRKCDVMNLKIDPTCTRCSRPMSEIMMGINKEILDGIEKSE